MCHMGGGGLCCDPSFMSNPEVLLFPEHVTICVPQSLLPLIGIRAAENGVARRFALIFRSQTFNNFL
jgi:hypothetical protein